MSAPPSFGIDKKKLTQYLLNSDHPDGASKAKLFLGNGFRRSEPELLAEALVTHAISGWPGEMKLGPAEPRR